MEKEYDIDKLKELIASKDVKAIKAFMEENDLVLSDGIIESKHKADFNDKAKFYDLKQYITKIKSNSAYGCILNKASTFYRFELGASITLSGRKVWQHLASKSNEILTNEYNYEGECVQTGDTDSKINSSIQRVMRNGKEIEETVEDLFNNCSAYHIDEKTGKEYGFTNDLVLGYDDEADSPKYYNINYVYRHKTSKPKWEIEDENGNVITVTSDHSCMVERNGELITVKPNEIKNDDILITIEDK